MALRLHSTIADLAHSTIADLAHSALVSASDHESCYARPRTILSEVTFSPTPKDTNDYNPHSHHVAFTYPPHSDPITPTNTPPLYTSSSAPDHMILAQTAGHSWCDDIDDLPLPPPPDVDASLSLCEVPSSDGTSANYSAHFSSRPGAVESNSTSDVYSNMPDTIPNDMPGAVPNNMPSAVPNNMPGPILNTMPGGVPSNIPGDILNNMPVAVHNNIPAALHNNMPVSVYNNMPVSVHNNMPGDIPNSMRDGIPNTSPDVTSTNESIYSRNYSSLPSGYGITPVTELGPLPVFVTPLRRHQSIAGSDSIRGTLYRLGYMI